MKLIPTNFACICLLALAFVSSSWAAGLGRLNVQSVLGQPLQAEVEITALTKEEENGLSVRLASQEAFRQAGLDFNPALLEIQLAVVKRTDGRTVVRVTTRRPLNEPFLDVLLELNWATGKLVRTYTLLLDPPELKLTRPAPPIVAPLASSLQPDPAATDSADLSNPTRMAAVESATAESAISSSSPAVAQPLLSPVQARALAQAQARAEAQASLQAKAQATAQARAAAEERAQAREAARLAEAAQRTSQARRASTKPESATAESGPARYTVKAGDTLSKIARAVGPQGVSLDQALVALYQNNQPAFVERNMNRLRTGQILAVPSAETAQAITPAQARQIVLAQTADFAAYREKLAQAVQAQQPRSQKSVAGQSASGKIVARVDDRATVQESADKLKLSTAIKDPNKNPVSGTAALNEKKLAEKKAFEEAQSRTQQLEKNVADLANAVKLKNEQLAQLEAAKQAQAKADAEKAKADAADRAKVEAEIQARAELAAREKAQAEAKLQAENAAKAQMQAEEKARIEAEERAKIEAEEKARAAQQTTQKNPETNTETAVVPPAPAVPPPMPSPVLATPTREATLINRVTDTLRNPWVLGGLGLLGLIATGYGLYRSLRRKKFQQFEDSIITATNLQANSVFRQTGGQSVDTNSMFDATFAPVNSAALDSNEVDPIAEADVYIAYGRQAQAEEILKEALRRDNHNQAVRLKLIELAAQRGEVKLVETLAGEMYAMTGGNCEEWPQVLSIGASLDPSNPMYSRLPTPAQVDTTPAAPAIAENTQVKPLDFDIPTNLTTSTFEPDTHADLSVDLPPDSALSVSTAQANFSEPDEPVLAMHFPDAANLAIELPNLPLDSTATSVPQELESDEQSPGANTDLELDLGTSQVPAFDEYKFDEKLDLQIDIPALQRLGEEVAPDATQTLSSPSQLAVDDLDLNLELSAEEDAANFLEDAEMPAHWQEIATKLDLAKAYLDIGDKEGAQELLEEVVDAGDAAQKAKAQQMLAEMT